MASSAHKSSASRIKSIDAALAAALPTSTADSGFRRYARACQLPNPKAGVSAAQDLLRVCRSVDWLPEELAQLTNCPGLLQEIEAIGASPPSAGLGTPAGIGITGYTASTSVYATLRDPNATIGDEHLRAILILAAVWREGTPGILLTALPAPTAIEVWAKSIRAAKSSSSHPLWDIITSFLPGRTYSPEECHEIISDAADESSRLTKSFIDAWGGFDAWLLEQGWRKRVKRRGLHQIGGIRKTNKSKSLPVQIELEMPEPGAPWEPTGERSTNVPIGDRPEPNAEITKDLSLRAELAKTKRGIWLRNTELTVDHIDVASDAELHFFLPGLSGKISEDIKTGRIVKTKLGTICGLGLATGMFSEQLAGIQLLARHRPGLTGTYSVETGTLRLQVYAPESAFLPSSTELFEATADYLDLPVVPAYVRFLNELYAIGETSLAPKSNLETIDDDVDAYARSIKSFPKPSLTIARIRRRFSAEIQRVTGDLGQTILLAGEHLGRADTPVYYYAPRAADIGQKYVDAIWPLFSEEPIRYNVQGGRIGAKGLVKTSEASQRMRKLGGRLNIPDTIAGLSEAKRAALVHNRLVDWLAYVIRIITTHRPTGSLLELTRWDFDLIGHSAILGDKKCDLAHRLRFVATTDDLSKSILGWLGHLEALAARLDAPKSLVKRSQGALSGKMPLLFKVNHDLTPRDISEIGEWNSDLPKECQELPANWYRTYVATRTRDHHAPGLLALIQLGHLDAAGRPFAKDSCMAPQVFADAMRAHLEKIWDELDIQIRSGLGDRPKDTTLGLPPIRDWSHQIKYHEGEQRAAALALNAIYRARRKSVIEKVRKPVLAHITEVDEQLGTELRKLFEKKGKKAIGKQKRAIAPPTPLGGTLSDEQFQLIQALNDDLYEKDSIAQVAAHNTLARYLRTARMEFGWETPDLRLWLPGSGAEPAPFLKGMMLARMQVHELRRHLLGQRAPSRGDELYVRCLLWLMLFNPFCSREQADQLILAAATARRVCRLQDLVLIDLESMSRKQARAARGLASLALGASMTKDLPKKTPDASVIAKHFAKLLPTWSSPGQANFLHNLWSTLLVNALIEESPLARFAMAEGMCVSAPTSFQRALLDKGKAGAIERAGGTPSADDNKKGVEFLEPMNSTKVDLVKRYKQVVRILRVPKGQRVYYERTQKSLRSTKGKRVRDAQCKEVRTFLAQKENERADVVHCIATFALDILESGTRIPSPAHSTVHTYVTTVGSRLLDVAPHLRVSDLTGDEFGELYEEVLEPFTGRSAARAAAQVSAFHNVLMKIYGVDDFDRSQLIRYFGQACNTADPHFLAPAEYQATLEELKRLIDASYDDDALTDAAVRRLHRMCRVALILLMASGGRSSEVFLLRHRDLVISGNKATLFVKATPYSWLKTPSARRLINIGERLNTDEIAILVDWVTSEAVRLGNGFVDTLPLFADLREGNLPTPSDVMRRRLIDVLSQVVGRPVRLHQLRHTWVQMQFMALLVGTDSKQNVAPFLPPHRLRSVSIQAGHARLTTTVASYFHMPWCLSSYLAATNPDWRARASLAPANNRSPGAFDRVIQRRAARREEYPKELADLLLLLEADFGKLPEAQSDKPPRKAKSMPAASRITARWMSPVDFEAQVRSVAPDVDLDTAAGAWGFSPEQTAKLRQAVIDLNQTCHYRLFPEMNTHGNLVHAPRPRMLKVGNPFLGWFFGVHTNAHVRERAMRLTDIFARSFRPSINSGLLLVDGDARYVQASIQGLKSGKNPSIPLLARENYGLWSLSITHKDSKVPLNRLLCWTLAIMWVYLRLSD